MLSTKGHRTKATLKFIAFGAEAIGLDGSYWYVVENIFYGDEVGIGIVNLDMIGVGDTLNVRSFFVSAPRQPAPGRHRTQKG